MMRRPQLRVAPLAGAFFLLAASPSWAQNVPIRDLPVAETSDAGVASDYEMAPEMEDLTSGNPKTEAAVEGEASTTASSKGGPEKAGGQSEVNGYLDSRSQYQRAWVNRVVPTNDLPQLDELIEANVQLRHTYSPHGFIYADVSAFAQFAGNFRGADANGTEIVLPEHSVAAYQPLFSINELYLSHEVSARFNLMAGKKRIVWGPGFAFNPTDLINPAKDPTDPSFQRAGAWMARAEANFTTYAFTFVAAPAVTGQASGIPSAFLHYPSWNAQDSQAHYQLAARMYALVANADVNLMVFYGNRYNDNFQNKLRVGATFSRYFFTDYEFHVEALLQQGSARSYANVNCFGSSANAGSCFSGNQPFLVESRLGEAAILPKVLAGTRRQFSDDSLLSIEYYFQNDGLTGSDFQRYVDVLEVASATSQSSPAATATGVNPSGGIPQKFTFNPVSKHYLIASYSKPKIFDDWTAGLTVLANLSDLSTLLSPSISWSATDWLTFTLNGFIPLSGPGTLGATTSSGSRVGEYSLAPIHYRGLFEVRIFY